MSNERPSMSLDVMIAFEFGLGLLAVGIGYLVGFDPLQTIPRGWEHWQQNAWNTALGAVLALPLLGGFMLLDRFVSSWTESIRRVLLESLAPTVAAAGWPGRAIVALSAGVGEEVLFRGLLQDGLTQWWGAAPALLFASLLFGLVHWISPAYLFFATAVGAMFGGLFLATGSLVTPIVMHAFYDYLAMERLAADYRSLRSEQDQAG